MARGSCHVFAGYVKVVRANGVRVWARGCSAPRPRPNRAAIADRRHASESRAVWDVVATLALAHPQVGFELTLDGRSRLSVPPGQPRDERLAAVWGEDVARTLLPVAHGVGPVFIEGFCQRPADAQPTGRRVQLRG